MRREVSNQQKADIGVAAKDIPPVEMLRKRHGEVIEPWESRRTLASKRLFSTIALLLAVAAWLDADYADIAFLGIRSNSTDFIRLSYVLALLLVLFGGAYTINLIVDINARTLQQKGLWKSIQRGLNALREIRSTLGLKRGEEIGFLILEENPNQGAVNGEKQQSISLLEDIQKHLVKSRGGQILVDVLEPVLIYSAALYGLFGLFQYWGDIGATSASGSIIPLF